MIDYIRSNIKFRLTREPYYLKNNDLGQVVLSYPARLTFVRMYNFRARSSNAYLQCMVNTESKDAIQSAYNLFGSDISVAGDSYWVKLPGNFINYTAVVKITFSGRLSSGSLRITPDADISDIAGMRGIILTNCFAIGFKSRYIVIANDKRCEYPTSDGFITPGFIEAGSTSTNSIYLGIHTVDEKLDYDFLYDC